MTSSSSAAEQVELALQMIKVAVEMALSAANETDRDPVAEALHQQLQRGINEHPSTAANTKAVNSEAPNLEADATPSTPDNRKSQRSAAVKTPLSRNKAIDRVMNRISPASGGPIVLPGDANDKGSPLKKRKQTSG